MAEVIDSQAREDVGKIWFRIGLIETVLWGIDKNNGIRSVTTDNAKKIQEITDRLQHYIDTKREETCIGLAEFAKRDAFKAEIEGEVTEVKTAEINAGATKATGNGQVVGMIVVALIQFGGLLVVALAK